MRKLLLLLLGGLSFGTSINSEDMVTIGSSDSAGTPEVHQKVDEWTSVKTIETESCQNEDEGVTLFYIWFTLEWSTDGTSEEIKLGKDLGCTSGNAKRKTTTNIDTDLTLFAFRAYSKKLSSDSGDSIYSDITGFDFLAIKEGTITVF